MGAINERVIYQLGNRRKEYIKTVLKEECWYGVQWAWFSRRLIDALTDLVFSYRLKGIESRGHRIRFIIERTRSRKRVPDFAYFIDEERSKRVHKAFFRGMSRQNSFRGAMQYLPQWMPELLGVLTIRSYKIGIVGTLVFNPMLYCILILCYELSDQEALALHQVKSPWCQGLCCFKGIPVGSVPGADIVSLALEVTQFCLKDVAWADPELFHLGPVVAAQQIHK